MEDESMPTLKILNGKGKYRNLDAKELVTEYILNPYKMKSGYCGGAGVDPQCPAESMELVSELYGKRDGVQIRHITLSFLRSELSDPAIVNDIACRLAQFIGREYQVIFGVHENTEQLHFHLAVNTVSYIDGHRCRGTKEEYYRLKNALLCILKDYGICSVKYVSSKD